MRCNNRLTQVCSLVNRSGVNKVVFSIRTHVLHTDADMSERSADQRLVRSQQSPQPLSPCPPRWPWRGRASCQNKQACGVSRATESPLQQDVTSGCDITGRGRRLFVLRWLQFPAQQVKHEHTAGTDRGGHRLFPTTDAVSCQLTRK